MQKISTIQARTKRIFKKQLTIGLDLGDRCSSYCVLDEAGIVLEQKLPTTPVATEAAWLHEKTIAGPWGTIHP